MRKRSILRAACALLTLLMLAGCTPTPAPAPDTDTDTAAVTDVTEPATNEATDPATEVETEPETEPPFIPTTPEEHRAEIERKTLGGTVGVGGFVTPADMNVTEKVFLQLKEAGINFMVTGNEFYGTVMLSNTLRVADKTGMDLALWTFSPNVFNADQVVTKLKMVVGHPSIKYIYMMDEPQEPNFPSLRDLKGRITRELGAYTDWKIGANLFPEATFPTVWYNMHKKYMSSVKPDYLCFDCYPWVGGGSGMDWFISNLGMAKKLTDEYGGELWCFLQTAKWGAADLPTDGKLRYQVNASLAMGVDTMIGFTTCDSGIEYINMMSPDGTPTDFFYVHQKVMNDMHAMKGVFLPFDCAGIMLRGEDAIQKMTDEKAAGVTIPDGAWETLKSVDGGRFLIGCMKDADGKAGFYVVNSDYENAATITLHFDGEHTYQLWNEKGLDKMGTADALTVELVPGGGCFVITDRSLDATTYPEPAPAPEKPTVTVPVAKADTMIFDLGFGEDGKAFNKVEDSVTTNILSGGTYAVVDGKPTLTKYGIYACDIFDAVKYGQTVEMYFKLNSSADRRQLCLFSDPNANRNLYRMAESTWHGSYDGADATLEGPTSDYLPIGEWLHVVSVYATDGTMTLYINGKPVNEYHGAYAQPTGSGFVFTDAKGDVNLAMARVYTYAADAAGAAALYAAVK